MKSFVLFTICLAMLCLNVAGQSIDPAAHKLFNEAETALCKGDTSTTITTLEALEKNYPTDGHVLITNSVLARLYSAQGRTGKAKAKLRYAIFYEPSYLIGSLKQNADCSAIIHDLFAPTKKADLCVTISQLYLKQRRLDSTLYFLNLADNKYLPYNGCGNGIGMYRSHLSPYFADCYLAMGDTTKAIERLLDFFMNQDGNTVVLTQKLKSILLQKWTQKQITEEINKGINQLKFVKGSDDYNFQVHLTLFGHTIKDYGSGKTSFYKELYRKNKGLKILKEN